MDEGMSYVQVQAAVPEAENIVSDPPVALDLDLARQHIAALDRLPRPTLITCRTGPRSSDALSFARGYVRARPPTRSSRLPTRTRHRSPASRPTARSSCRGSPSSLTHT